MEREKLIILHPLGLDLDTRPKIFVIFPLAPTIIAYNSIHQ